MSHKDAQELAKLNKQQMQAAVAQAAAAAGGAPTGAAVLTTPPPPQQQQQAPSYPPAALSFAPNPAAGPHQYSTLPSPAAAALLSYNTAFGSYSLNDQTAQLLSTAPGPRQTTTQYPYLGIGQTAYNQAGNMFIHQPTTPSPTSADLASQLPPTAYRLPASAYGPNSGAPQLSSAGAPPNPTTLYMSAASVKQSNSGVGAIGTKTNYQPTGSLYMYDPTMISPAASAYLSQSQQQRAAASGSSFYSQGTAAATGQSPAFYSGSAHYAPSSPYGMSYGGQSPAPTGQQQMSTAGMGIL
uniref:Uncharacterized protein n=1 Tax=Cacopsylla melanoneura TaxID=428564 RepID=A0A8D8VTJ5_9HEMI